MLSAIDISCTADLCLVSRPRDIHQQDVSAGTAAMVNLNFLIGKSADLRQCLQACPKKSIRALENRFSLPLPSAFDP
jgi:hypothetical protein